MKTIHCVLLIGLATAAVLPAWAEDNEAAKKDLARLQGEWLMVSGSADGQAMPDTVRPTSKRVCKGDETEQTR